MTQRKRRIVRISRATIETRNPLSEIMLRLFGSRLDTYAEQYVAPDRKVLWRRVNEPLTLEVLEQHSKGERTIGAYTINPQDQTCRWGTGDFDVEVTGGKIEDLTKEADKFIAVLLQHGIPEKSILREFSGSKGYHVWVFFDPPVPAIVVYHMLRNAANEAGVKCEIFPKQKQLLSEFGNLVKLPCGIHQATKQRCRLYNEKWEPVDPVHVLKIEPVVTELKEVEAIKQRLLAEDKAWMDRAFETGEAYVGEDPPCIAKYLSGTGATIGHRHAMFLRLAGYFLTFRKLKLQPDGKEKVEHILREWNKCNQPSVEEARLDPELRSLIEDTVNNNYMKGCDDEYLAKYCDLKNCPIKKHQIPILLGEFTHEEIAAAEELLRNPYLLKDFDEVSDTWIAEDYAVRRISLRTYVSALTDDPANWSLLGRDSIGKTYNAVTTAKIVKGQSKPSPIWMLGGISPTALVHDYSEYDRSRRAYVIDLRGITMLFLEPPHPDTWARLRPILSHDAEEVEFRITDKSKGGRLRTKHCILLGWPAFVQCAAITGHEKGEYTSRWLTGTPQISRDKTEKAIDKLLEKAEEPKRFRFNVGKARVWAAAFRLLREEAPISVKIPFAKTMKGHIAIRGPDTTRFIAMMLRLVMANAALHIRQRKRDAEGCVLAEPKDLEQVIPDFEVIAASSAFGVSGDALQLYENLKGKADLTYEQIEEAAREVFGAETADTTLRNLYIRRLVQAGLFTEKTDVSDKRRVLYTAATKPSTVTVFKDKEAMLRKIILQWDRGQLQEPKTAIVPGATVILSPEKEPKMGLFPQPRPTPPPLPPLPEISIEPKVPLREQKRPLASFRCGICGALCSSKELLEEHQATVHGIEKEDEKQ